MSAPFSTPVVLLVFNRPEHTQQLLDRLRPVQPAQVQTNFADANRGLRARVVSGLDWAFSQVERAIILEDDCLPARSFFGYCAELLEHYAAD